MTTIRVLPADSPSGFPRKAIVEEEEFGCWPPQANEGRVDALLHSTMVGYLSEHGLAHDGRPQHRWVLTKRPSVVREATYMIVGEARP